MKLHAMQYGIIVILLLMIIILLSTAILFNRQQSIIYPTSSIDNNSGLTKTAIVLSNDALETEIYLTKESP